MVMKKRILVVIGWAALTGAGLSAHAQQKKGNSKDTIPAVKPKVDSPVVKTTPYDRLLKDPQKVVKGLMNLYYVKGKLYLEVPNKVLDKNLLLASTISEISDNYDGIVGSKPQAPMQVKFTKADSSLLLCKVENNMITPGNDNNIQRALEKNSIGAILKIFPVAALNNDRSAAVIDVTEYFVSDNKDMSPFNGFSTYKAMGFNSTQSFKRDRSYIGDIKSFADNVVIKSHLSYENTYTSGTRVLEKERPFTAVMTRTFLLLSDQPARPRIADSRIGIFTTRKNRLSNEVSRTEPVYYANRWKLEPKDVAAFNRGERTEPVKPITFYVDSDFPESWKKPVKEAILQWNLAFEKAGFKNAVVALDYPANDPAFDPDNLKYNCVRYSPVPVGNAVGPSWVDPRSGEIINASVYVFHDVIKLLNNWMFIQTAPADKAVRQVNLPDAYKEEGLKYVVRHEIGHCLGFMHNMGASSPIPVDSLRSATFTQQYGTTYSIMDYARFNYIAQPGDKERGVQLAPPVFGVYDHYLVQWNYAFFDSTVSPEQEKSTLASMIAAKAGDARYRYGAQDLMFFDPSDQTEDLGDDAVQASVYGIKNLRYIMQHLNSWVGAQDKDYTYRQQVWQGILSQYVRYINHVQTNIGGIYINEKHTGDPRPFYEPVSRRKQEKALQFLLNELLTLDWLEDKQVLENLTLVGTPASAIRDQIMDVLLLAPIKVNLAAIKSTEARPLTSKEVMRTVYAAVWKKTIRHQTPNKAEKEMQKTYVRSMIKNVRFVSPAPGSSAAITDLYTNRIQLPEPVPAIHGMGCLTDFPDPTDRGRGATPDPRSGFGAFWVNFNLVPALESEYFAQLTDCRKLLQAGIAATTHQETAMHYRLLLHQIEKALK
jgi:hypothetical protein